MKSKKPKTEPVTIERLRKIQSYENRSDEEANESIVSLDKLARILCEHLQRQSPANFYKGNEE